MKMMREQEASDGKSGRHGGKMDGAPAVGIGDMRDMMKNQLMNVKLYENSGSHDNLLQNRKGNSKVTLNELEGSYKMA